MTLHDRIHELRTKAGLSQDQFAERLGVARQSVQKWESGASQPELDKLIRLSKMFDVTLDTLVLGSDRRILEEMRGGVPLLPSYESIPGWEQYSSEFATEYQQSLEEGLDVEAYRELFLSAARLPAGDIKKRLGDVLFDLIQSAPTRKDYPYTEPSDLAGIRALRERTPLSSPAATGDALRDKIAGAWMGRICGCMLGKSVEGVRTRELHPFLRETGNFPMKRYIRRADITDAMQERYSYPFIGRPYADTIDGMPVDDDTNYTVLAQELIRRYGRDFTPANVAETWFTFQGKDAYCTAERVAYCNFIRGYRPPASAMYQNPYREWIGAQIRGDYFGYINPGNPELAAEMAFRDASISHVKNGIYGEMFVAAALAAAACTSDMQTILRAGIGEIPSTSRLYEAISDVMQMYADGVSSEECMAEIHRRYDEATGHGWCHTIPNAMIVAAALLYGEGDYGRTVCMTVETGFDTDCNGATAGSILGMARGDSIIGDEWRGPIGDKLHTSIFGVGTVSIADRVALTMEQM